MKNKQSSIISLQDISKLWNIVRKNWWIVFLFLIASSVSATIYLYKQTEVFSASTQILLKSNDQYNSGSIITDNMSNFYGNASRTFVDNSNEKRVLQSSDLIEKAIDRLDFDVSYFIVGRLKTAEQFSGVPFKLSYTSINPALVERFLGFRIIDQQRYRITYTKNNEEVVKTGYFDKDLVDIDLKINVKKTNYINPATIKSLSGIEYQVQIHNHSSLVAQYLGSLSVENPDFTNILKISVSDVIPRRAMIFLDTLSKVYIENTLQSQFDINENTLEYIDKELKEVTAFLNDIEDSMQLYKEQKDILDLDKEGDSYFKKLSQYDQMKSDLGLQIGSLNDLEKYIIEGKDPEFLPPSVYIVSNDMFLRKSTSELYDMQIDRNEALNRATTKSIPIQEIDNKIDAMKKNLLTYIGNARTATKESILNLEKEISDYTADIRTLPVKQRGLISIQRKLAINEKMYEFLLQKKANTIIGKAGIIPLTKVIESPKVDGVIYPEKKKIFYSFILISLVISLLIVTIRALFFYKIETVNELKESTFLPVVGEVIFSPTIKELKIAVESEPKSAIAESFRSIRTNLQYMALKPGAQVIVITSNSPGEGKTFCSLNLSAILAKASKKVLILELDLHKPRVQKGLGMEADVGISTIVIEKNSIEECVKHSQIENLDVILSGPLPPNPSEIILSKHLTKIIEYGRANYDYVIVDTPPVGLISDALMLMKQADISLFVVNTKFAYSNSIKNAEEIVTTNKLNNFGFILNGVKRKKSKYYYNRYGYGYGYGSGYGAGYGGYGGYSGYGGTS